MSVYMVKLASKVYIKFFYCVSVYYGILSFDMSWLYFFRSMYRKIQGVHIAGGC